MLITHANNPKVIRLTGSKRILRNGFTITVRSVSTIPVAISILLLANRTSGEMREMRYKESVVKITVFNKDFIVSF
jgi:hypothetical protein